MVSVVAGVWEFATSGLEMSMVFLWLGARFLLLVRVEAAGAGRCRRPSSWDSAHSSGPSWPWPRWSSLVALLLVVAAPGWSRAATPRPSATALPLAAALVLPVAFELFRMGYYALLGSQHRAGQGRGGRLVVPGLHLPVELRRPLHVVVAACCWRSPSCVLPALRWWRRGDRIGRGGAGHAGRGRAGRHPLRGACRGRLHARPVAPARILRPLPSHLRLHPPGPKRPGRAPDRDRGVGSGLCRLAPVRPPKGDQPQSPDRVHLQRAQQLDQRHRQSTPDHGDGLPQGSLRERPAR